MVGLPRIWCRMSFGGLPLQCFANGLLDEYICNEMCSTQDFMQMLRRREGERLDVWLSQVRASHIPELQRFVRSIE